CTPVCGAQAQAQQASPQATFTPVGCNITLATLCTPVCGAQAAAAPQGASPQATFTPVNCNITVFSVCTPICGAAAAQQGGGVAPQASFTPICPQPQTFGIYCPPPTLSGVHCPGPITQSPATICGQLTHPPICLQTPTTIVTTTHPVTLACNTIGPNQGVSAQATFGPIQCNVTVFSICTPICGG
ncbi:MAG TPA: hypothetical protein VLF18_03370, partial [Tahibacter sp.]|uniref:hypothetical protein n=1 Tax=Tahibacter sp. TaxID=2056211 RepID=UPI002B819D9A